MEHRTSNIEATWLAESGSTKTDWVCLAGPQQGRSFKTAGFNPNYLPGHELADQLVVALFPELPPEQAAQVGRLHYYGAGSAGPVAKAHMLDALLEAFPHADIEVEHDLLAAARGLWGHNPGLVGILGTGSHACYYNGTHITDETVSLGYLLGDEGGGVYLGKRLVQDYFYDLMPTEERADFRAYLAMDRHQVVDRLYRQAWPNRWLASLTPWLAAQLAQPIPSLYAAQVLADNFDAYANLHLQPLLARHPGAALAVTGSIGHHFSDALRAVVSAQGITLERVLANPLEGLIEYHQG